MLRHCNDASSARLRGGAQATQHRFVVGDVFNHVECPGEIEQSCRRDVSRIHLREFHLRRQAPPRIRQAGWMQFRTDQTFPAARFGDGAENETGATTYFQESARLWKVLIRQADNQLVARDEPEMFLLQFNKFVERVRIEAAHGVSKLRCERRNALCLLNHMAASGTMP